MEPIRFADILFIFLTLVITFAILCQVNKTKMKSKKMAETRQAKSGETANSDQERV